MTTQNTTDNEPGEALLSCPWCAAISDSKDQWGYLITHKSHCYWLNTHGDPIGRVRVNFSEVEQWNSRAPLAAVEVHWQLKAGVEQAMCGVPVKDSLTTLIPDMASCHACTSAAWGYKCGRAAAITSPETPVGGEPWDDIDNWPVPSMLEHLAGATEHLLRDHNCDEHGHETWKYAAEAARKHVALLNGAAPVSAAGDDEGSKMQAAFRDAKASLDPEGKWTAGDISNFSALFFAGWNAHN